MFRTKHETSNCLLTSCNKCLLLSSIAKCSRWTFNTIPQHIVWWENCITKTHKILEFSLLHAYFIPSKNKIQWHNLIKLAKIVQICLFNVTVNTRLCFQRKHVLKEYSAVSRQQGLSLYIISQVFIPPPEVIQRARDYPVTEQWLHFSTAPGNLDVLGIICLLGF